MYGNEIPDFMSFDDALFQLKRGVRVRRFGWNGKGMYLIRVSGMNVRMLVSTDYDLSDKPVSEIISSATHLEVKYPPHIAMKTVDGTFVPWLASVTDMMTDDWYIVDNREPF